VISTTPAPLTIGVDPTTSITVTFSEVMDGTTLTTNTNDTTCSGTVQLSTDDFATCVQMQGPPSTGDDITYTVTPASALASATTYAVRVLGSVSDGGGTPMGGDFDDDGFVIRYYHTITIDGVNDFTADETFSSTTLGHTGYVAWDDTHVYLGMSSPDLGSNSPFVWFVSYLGGMPGSTTGVLYNTQQPLLPFAAGYHTRWKASDDFGGTLAWNGNAWANANFGPIVNSGDVATAGSFVELRIAWTDIGAPDMLELAMGMLREQPFNEASWAGVPAGAYVDSYDPDIGSYYEFDVLGSTLPAEHSPL
jgi:hypothetical protein